VTNPTQPRDPSGQVDVFGADHTNQTNFTLIALQLLEIIDYGSNTNTFGAYKKSSGNFEDIDKKLPLNTQKITQSAFTGLAHRPGGKGEKKPKKHRPFF
jgi:hypothetical protein